MVTLDELFNNPRFRKMSEEELAEWIARPTTIADTISNPDYWKLEPAESNLNKKELSLAKARNLIAKWKAEEKSIPEPENLHSRRDARVWAEYYCKHNPEASLDIMTGWFANAMMAMHDSIYQNNFVTPKEEQPIRLKEGMGVLNATREQKIIVEKLARECGLTVYDTLDDGWEAFHYRGDIIVSCHGYYVTHPVTFREFCQAILNEEKPKRQPVDMGKWSVCNQCNQRMCYCEERQVDRSWKPKEETVKLNSRYKAVIWSGGVNLMLNGKTETSFPLSIVDELVAAKERVTK